MALPDRFEQAGIVVGSVLLVGLPVSALVSALYGLSIPPWQAALVWFLPGLVVGVPLAMGRLPVTYHQLWVLTLTSWLLAFGGWTALGLSLPASDPVLAVGVWLLAVLVGALLAWLRPIATIRGHLQPS